MSGAGFDDLSGEGQPVDDGRAQSWVGEGLGPRGERFVGGDRHCRAFFTGPGSRAVGPTAVDRDRRPGHPSALHRACRRRPAGEIAYHEAHQAISGLWDALAAKNATSTPTPRNSSRPLFRAVLSPCTYLPRCARHPKLRPPSDRRRWFDGVVAKPLTITYQPDKRVMSDQASADRRLRRRRRPVPELGRDSHRPVFYRGTNRASRYGYPVSAGFRAPSWRINVQWLPSLSRW